MTRNGAGRVALITCGALGREVGEIVGRRGWPADIVGVPSFTHMYPEQITPEVEKRIEALRAEGYERIAVLFADCGTAGRLDRVLAEHGVERLPGHHCYDVYAGEELTRLMAEEPGTYFLTDFLIRAFEGSVVRGMGLDRFPQLTSVYFANYTRLVYLAQTDDGALLARAHEIAERLGLRLEVRRTGVGRLEAQIERLMNAAAASAAD